MNMKVSTNFIVPALAITIAGAGLLWAAQPAQAQAQGDTNHPFHQQLIQKLAQRFNASESDVQNVFTEVKQAHRQEMGQKMLAALDQAVTNGELSEAQKQAIIAKQQELRQQHELEMANFKDLTPEERKTKMEAHRVEIETWAKDQGIDAKYVMPKFKVKMMKHPSL
jgi:AraC-like DNA-binding protein